MRYYKIELTDPKTGAAILPSSLQGLPISSLRPDGSDNPGALNVTFDLPISTLHTPGSNAYVRIWGLGLKDIGGAFNLNGCNISVYGGMTKGLPLANPAQSGLLIAGQVLQATGNWLGLEQTVDLFLGPAMGTVDAPKNFVLNWRANTTLASALQTTFSVALPNTQVTINLSPNLVQNHDEVHFCGTAEQLASIINDISKSIVKDPNYPGASIVKNGIGIVIADNSKPPKPKLIAFPDLMGQPVWIDPFTVQSKMVLRYDINLFDIITLPPGLIQNTPQQQQRFQDKTTFTGEYLVNAIHHYGDFRQPDAFAWNTTFNMIQQQKVTGT